MSVRPGSTNYQPPSSSLVWTMNWSSWLVGNATISTSSWTIVNPPDAALTKDNETIPSGSTTTQLRLIGGTLGKTYKILNTVVTNESPTQTGNEYFYVCIR